VTNDALPLALVAVGQTFVVLTNGIDLSTGAIVGLADVVIAVLGNHALSGIGIVIVLAIGAFAGLANGLIVCYCRIAPLITTLATGSIILGITLDILSNPGGTIPAWLHQWTSGQVGSVPVAGIWLVVLAVASSLLLRRTKFGIAVQAIGGSESSSFSTGIKVVRVRTLAYTVSGVCSALAGITLAGLSLGGDPTTGASDTYLLYPIAALVIGGTSLAGGVGTTVGSVLGALILSLVFTVLQTSHLSSNLDQVVSGAIVIGALLIQSPLWGRAARRLRLATRSVAASRRAGHPQ
jgi:ribose transport system permease protein